MRFIMGGLPGGPYVAIAILFWTLHGTAALALDGAVTPDAAPEEQQPWTLKPAVRPNTHLSSAEVHAGPLVVGQGPLGQGVKDTSWIADEVRSLWLSTGTGIALTLGLRLFLGAPLVIGAAALVPPTSLLTVPLILGAGGVFLLAEASLVAWATSAVFDAASRAYNSSWVVAFSSHIAGSLLGGMVAFLPMIANTLVIAGAQGIVAFTGGAGFNGLAAASALMWLPAVVVGAVALVALPALTTTWALTAGARAKPGFVIAPDSTSALLPDARSRENAVPLVTVPLPGPT